MRFFPIKTCQSVRPWSDRNEANWGHRGGVRLRLIDDTEVWRETEERAINVWPGCVRKTSGERKNNTLIYQEQDAELKARREGRALTQVSSNTSSLFRGRESKELMQGYPKGQTREERSILISDYIKSHLLMPRNKVAPSFLIINISPNLSCWTNQIYSWLTGRC